MSSPSGSVLSTSIWALSCSPLRAGSGAIETTGALGLWVTTTRNVLLA